VIAEADQLMELQSATERIFRGSGHMRCRLRHNVGFGAYDRPELRRHDAAEYYREITADVAAFDDDRCVAGNPEHLARGFSAAVKYVRRTGKFATLQPIVIQNKRQR